ncbi:stalk domain-containing protein [Paenibacillus sp. VCA1]|uniref:stalk domain-containing protein n=1 Tax=Paenibacillus sp. VCA1 TaxID=3039148 RepID=UPI0028718C44|nr:stalk domain-containing protein [Paenibacillus sp. VCA1]MDR9853986.1 stalk domain-containing protein [Paenibacillus sp. VCA1]
MQAFKTKTGAGLLLFFAMLLATGFWGLKQAHAEAPAPIKVAVDTKWVSFSVDPLLDGGTTLVQMRPLFESMGISLKWDQKTRTISGQKGSMSFTLKVDSPKAVLNGKEIALDKPARVIQGNTLVPLRFVGEATGGLVAWDPKNREITIFSEEMLSQLGLTKEQAAEILNKNGTMTTSNPPKNPPGTGQTGGDEETAPAETVKLDKLQGMYVGMRLDPGGYECGGACWDYYTFLLGQKIVVGEPVSGGPETIDCSKQACTAYSINNNRLSLSNGKSYSIRVSAKGNLFIEDVQLAPVKPVTANFKLSGSYVYRGYSGMAGANSASSAWEEWITFQTDGTFKSDNLTLGSADTGSGSTNSSAGASGTGTYAITGNTITLKFSDGKTERFVFFVHPGKDGKPNPQDIQIGDRNFYVDND